MIAAEQYASRLVVPQSPRTRPSGRSSHKDHATKALKKLAGPHLPGSLHQLEAAVKRAHEDSARTERAARECRPTGAAVNTEGQPAGDAAEGEVDANAVEHSEEEDLAEPAAT